MADETSDNLQPWAIATTASVTGMALLSVLLRLLSRYERKQKLWWDDWMIIMSMLWNLVVVGFIFGMIGAGMGKHAAVVPTTNIVLMAKLLLVAEVLYAWNLIWTKISFLLMYYRIFNFPYFKRWAQVIGTFCVMWGFTITFLFIFICVPVQKLWYADLPGRCIDQVGTWISNATSTIITDLIILFLPIPQIWKLQLRRAEKVALTVTFGLGCFVVFASVYRFTVLFSYSALDPPYTLTRTVGWTAIEMSAGITSCCLPTLRPAFEFIVRNLGIKGSFINLFRGINESTKNNSLPSNTSGLNKSNNDNALESNTGRAGNRGKGSQTGAFYRLSEAKFGGKGGSGDLEGDEDLRPGHGYAYAVDVTSTSTKREDGESLDGDEIPLQGIRVHTDFVHEAKG